MTAPISISITSADPAPEGGPVGLVLDVRNTSTRTVQLDLSYPAPIGLTARSADGRASSIGEPQVIDMRMIPLVLAAGAEQRTVHALNRWLAFPGPGTYPIDVHLVVHVDREPFTFDQRVTVEILPATEESLRAALDRAAAALTSDDRLTRAMAVEALVHLSTPAAIPYLERVLALDNERADAMIALGRIGTPDALDRIERALPDGDSRAVAAGLAALASAGRVPSSRTLGAILGGRNEAAAYACLEYLLQAGTADHAPLVAPLAQSANPAVAELARRFLDKVRP